MTLRNNARLAGVAYLLYIAVAFPDMVLSGRATAGATPAERLTTLARNQGTYSMAMVLGLISAFCAFALAVSLRGLTKAEDEDLSFFAAICRTGEGITSLISVALSVGLLALATSEPRDPAIAFYIFNVKSGLYDVGSTSFAVGSTLFCWLLLRGRLLPVWLAWIGVVGSAMVAVGVPLQMASVLSGPITQLMWIPIAIFEIVGAFWLIIKGVSAGEGEMVRW
jgi:hypothetical protein